MPFLKKTRTILIFFNMFKLSVCVSIIHIFCFFIDGCIYEYIIVTLTYTFKQDLKNILCNIVFYEKDGSGQVVTFISGQVVTPFRPGARSRSQDVFC